MNAAFVQQCLIETLVDVTTPMNRSWWLGRWISISKQAEPASIPITTLA